MLRLVSFATLFTTAIAVRAPINYHYQTLQNQQPNTQTNTQYGSYHRPGSSGSHYASSSIYSNRPQPVRDPETVDYEDNDDDGEDAAPAAPVASYPAPYKIKKQQAYPCIPYGGIGGIGGFGGLFNPLSLFRSNDIDRAESRGEFDDPRTILKLQFNDFNFGNGAVYKPSGGYACRPSYNRPHGLLGGLFGNGFGGGGLFGNRPYYDGVRPQYDEGAGGTAGNRPQGTIGILSDTVKPIFSSTAIQDGIGSTIGNWQPGQGVANILTAIGGITGQFATAPLQAVNDVRNINKGFADLLFN